MKSATEYWKERFDEYPQNDAERLAVVMMMEYYHDITKDEVVKNNLVKPDVSGRSELLLSFFLWFRQNGELYVDKSIEDMISIYEKESNSH